MAVYTDVVAEELGAFLAGYDLGELLAYKGIAEGVENSNFLVHTTRGYFILTLYERRVSAEDLPFFFGVAGNSFGQYGGSLDVGRRFGLRRRRGLGQGEARWHLVRPVVEASVSGSTSRSRK